MNKLNAVQLDIITEIINIGIGRSAAVLNTMLKSHIQLRPPEVKQFEAGSFNVMSRMTVANRGLAAVEIDFKGSMAGSAKLVFPADRVTGLVTAFTGKDHTIGFDEISTSSMDEIGNVVLNAVMGSIGNMLKIPLEYDVPEYISDFNLNQSDSNTGKAIIFQAKSELIVEESKTRMDIDIIMAIKSLKNLIRGIYKFRRQLKR